LEVLYALPPVWADDQQDGERGNHEGDQQANAHDGERESEPLTGGAVDGQTNAEKRRSRQRTDWHENASPPLRGSHLGRDIHWNGWP
jgi:hypothetical protein